MKRVISEDIATATVGTIEASMSNMMNSNNNNKGIVKQQNRNQNYSKTAPLSIGSSDDFTSEDSNNLFFLDRIVYHLWFHIFLGTLQKGDITTQKEFYLMVKIITQMLNESIGSADHWVFVKMVEAMGRCG